MFKLNIVLIIAIIMSCGKDKTSQSLEEVYLKSSNYDEAKQRIPLLKLKHDLIDSTQIVSYLKWKGWEYRSIDEFKDVRIINIYDLDSLIEMNLILLLQDQENNEEYIARIFNVYSKREERWFLKKHKMFEIEPLDYILIKKDSVAFQKDI